MDVILVAVKKDIINEYIQVVKRLASTLLLWTLIPLP